MRKPAVKSWLVSAFVLCLSGCAGYVPYTPPKVLPDDHQNIPEPRPRDTTIVQDAFEYGVVVPTNQLFDFARHIRSLSRNKRQALNVDAFDEVRDSSWFTNRNAREPLSLEVLARGPDKGTGPETQGPWTITSAKVEGYTPGFNIRDANGDNYLIKFDPYGFLELSSAAEVITGKIFYAAGYNVPENYIVVFDPAILQMEAGIQMQNEKGVRCEMTGGDFSRIMQKVELLPDGRVRALASKYLEGVPLGGFRYLGRRQDDPNDIVDHEYRRELRGMYVMCAWLKHFDIKDANSLDMYVREGNRRFIRHYLIDFGSTLGGAPEGPMDAFRGHETDFDLAAGFKNLVTLGLDVKDWEKAPQVEYPSVGRFSAVDFVPGNTDMNILNPAFAMRTNLDGYWGAKLVMSFSDEQLKVLVREGQFSDPAAEEYLLQVLKLRRDMTGRYWYSRVNCLDRFTLNEPAAGLQELRFTDLGIKGKIWSDRETRYRAGLRIDGELVQDGINLPEGTVIQMSFLKNLVERSGTKNGAPQSGDEEWELSLIISRDFGQTFGKWVKVYLSHDQASGTFRLLGLRRQD